MSRGPCEHTAVICFVLFLLVCSAVLSLLVWVRSWISYAYIYNGPVGFLFKS